MRKLLLYLFVTFSIPFFAQSDDIQPLKLEATPKYFHQLMGMTQPTSRQIDSIIHLSVAYSYNNEDTCLLLGEKAVLLSKDFSDVDIYAKALLELGDSYRIFGQLDEGEKLLLQAKAIYEELEDAGQIAQANNKLGALNKNKGDNESAINFYLTALETWETLKDSQNIVKPLINIGAVFRSMDRLDRALEYYQRALILADKIKDDRAIFYVLNNQGIVYTHKASSFKEKMDTSSVDKKFYRDSMDFFANKSIASYERSLEMSRKKKDQRNVIRVLTNLTDVYVLKENYTRALELNSEAKTLNEDFGEVKLELSIMNRMAQIYNHSGKLTESIAYAEKAAKLAKEHQMEKFQSEAEAVLYKSYKASGQYKKALKYFESSKEYTDKNRAIGKNKAIAEVETRYQTVKKEKQILQQKNDIMELETTNAKIVRQRNSFIGGTLLLALLSYLGFNFLKIRRERNDKMAFAEALIFAQEEERKRIARDLHDGVGQSLLLIKKQMALTHETTIDNQRMITDTLEEVRSISRDLHPFQLEKFGLTSTISDMILKIEKSTELFITKEIENIDGAFAKKSEIHIYRAIQESLNNIVKHADATAAKISIQTIGNEVVIKVMDNGKGYDHELTVVNSKSMGLRTMNERISSIGGTIKVEKNEPSGTVVVFNIRKI